MEFVRVIKGYNHLWAVKDLNKELDELADLFSKWNNADYLLEFFMHNITDLQAYFHINRISQAINDTFEDADDLESLILEFPYTESLDEIFAPLDITDIRNTELTRRKARNWDRHTHASWLRIYAVRIESNVYVITGGAIKLTRLMQDREHTQLELEKLNACKRYLNDNGVFDKDSFIDLSLEDKL